MAADLLISCPNALVERRAAHARGFVHLDDLKAKLRQLAERLMHGHASRSICSQLTRPCRMSAQTLGAGERDFVLAAAIESAIVRIDFIAACADLRKIELEGVFVVPPETFSANSLRNFSSLGHGVNSAATAQTSPLTVAIANNQLLVGSRVEGDAAGAVPGLPAALAPGSHALQKMRMGAGRVANGAPQRDRASFQAPPTETTPSRRSNVHNSGQARAFPRSMGNSRRRDFAGLDGVMLRGGRAFELEQDRAGTADTGRVASAHRIWATQLQYRRRRGWSVIAQSDSGMTSVTYAGKGLMG